MATNLPPNDIKAFYQFLGERISGETTGLTPEQSVEDFRVYQNDVERLRKQLEPSIEQANRGESKPLDVEATIERVTQRLRDRGETQ